MKDYNKQFDELIERINKLRADINKHFGYNNGQWAELVKPSVKFTIDGYNMHISGLTEEQIQKVKEVLG